MDANKKITTNNLSIGVPKGTVLTLSGTLEDVLGDSDPCKLTSNPMVLKFLCDIVASGGMKPSGDDIVADLKLKATLILKIIGGTCVVARTDKGPVVLTTKMF